MGCHRPLAAASRRGHILAAWPVRLGPGSRDRNRLTPATPRRTPALTQVNGSGSRKAVQARSPGSAAASPLFVDWLLAYGLAALAMTLGVVSMGALSTAVLVIWLALGVISVPLFGFTTGQLVLDVKVMPVDNRPRVGFGRALARGLLITLVIPALFTDSDLRGLQDLATKTAVVRR